MTEFDEVVSCDGSCGLSPADHEREHPHPITALRDQMASTIGGTMILRTSPTEIANAVLAQIEKHPSLTIRHYAPTQDAYDRACAALEKHRKRADDAERIVEELRRLHHGPRTERHGSGCIQCGILWPCPSAKAVGLA